MKKLSKPFAVFASAALSAMLGLASCSGSETEHGDSGAPTDNAIRFAATAEFSRFSGDVTTNNLSAFNVYAYTGNETKPDVFMDNVEVTKTTYNTWTYSPIKYWPSDKTVDFYAFAPAEWLGPYNPLGAIPYDATYGVDDIVYAVSPGLSGSAGMANAQVLFNFRHALAKLTVKMSSTNTHLRVRVTNVALANVKSKGNFHFPAGSTSDAPDAENVGTWKDQNTPVPYILHMSQRPEDIITLTSTATDMGTTTYPGSRYLIPQELTWLNNGRDPDTYIAVMGSVYDAETGEKLWPNDNTPPENIVGGSTFGDGLLKFPLSTSAFHEWKAGYHYVYNLVINSNEDMGAIEFGSPTVDTFVEVETSYQ